MPQDNATSPPPYVSYGTFKTTIDQLAESTVPTGPLDRRVLDWLSGADYGALMSALRFLGLVDNDRKATADYRKLAQSSKDGSQFKEELFALLETKYKPIIGSVDLNQGTITELEKAFKDYGVPSGQMLTKTIRFFVKAVTECGVKLSPHITKSKPRTPRAPTAKNGGEKNRASRMKETPREQEFSETPKGFGRMPIPGVEQAYIQYPNDLTQAQCTMFEKTIEVLRAYAEARTGGKEKKS